MYSASLVLFLSWIFSCCIIGCSGSLWRSPCGKETNPVYVSMPIASTSMSKPGCRSSEACQSPHGWAWKWNFQLHLSLHYGSFGQQLDGNLIKDSKPEAPSWVASKLLSHGNCDKPLNLAIICYAAKITDILHTHYCLLLVPHKAGLLVYLVWSWWYQSFYLVIEHCLETFVTGIPTALTPHFLREWTWLPIVPFHWLEHS